MTIPWNKITEEKFKQLIGKIPVFLRDFARKKISQKAENIVKEDNRKEVSEKDMVDAFFAETPFGFQGPMKNDMEEFSVDYTKYGYKR